MITKTKSSKNRQFINQMVQSMRKSTNRRWHKALQKKDLGRETDKTLEEDIQNILRQEIVSNEAKSHGLIQILPKHSHTK
jgi:uncharacterized protein involved in exopolysaccharide biosynthesis